MDIPTKKGFGFGLASGVITTLGLMMGLDASTGSKFVVIAGILTIAFCDALSDAFGMHLSEETALMKEKSIWESTGSTFIAKLLIALTFLLPVVLLPMDVAIKVGVAWGLILIALFSVWLAKKEHLKWQNVVLEHLMFAIFVIVASYGIGLLVKIWFG